MDLQLVRGTFEESGVFGSLMSLDGRQKFAVTLEHAYPIVGNTPPFLPKLSPGFYTCMRGMHRLHGMDKSFETFEVTGVPGHSGILFHVGNYNADSEGCILLGSSRQGAMISDSKTAFQNFMKLQEGEDSFYLRVV